MSDIYEEIYIDIENNDKYTQDMGRTFMSPHGVWDENFTKIINQNLQRLDTVQYPVSIVFWLINYLAYQGTWKWLDSFFKRKEKRGPHLGSTLSHRQKKEKEYLYTFLEIHLRGCNWLLWHHPYPLQELCETVHQRNGIHLLEVWLIIPLFPVGILLGWGGRQI